MRFPELVIEEVDWQRLYEYSSLVPNEMFVSTLGYLDVAAHEPLAVKASRRLRKTSQPEVIEYFVELRSSELIVKEAQSCVYRALVPRTGCQYLSTSFCHRWELFIGKCKFQFSAVKNVPTLAWDERKTAPSQRQLTGFHYVNLAVQGNRVEPGYCNRSNSRTARLQNSTS